MKKLIDELTALEAKASPGPWATYYSIQGFHTPLIPTNWHADSKEDVDLIVAMRNALPELLNMYNNCKTLVDKAYGEAHEMRNQRDAAIARAEKANLAEAKAKFDRGIVYAQLSYFNAHGDFEDLITEKNDAIARAEKAEADLRNEQRVVAGYRVMLNTAKAERNWLAKTLAKKSKDCICDDAYEETFEGYWLSKAQESTKSEGGKQ